MDEDIHEALTERSSSMKTFSTRLSFTATCGMLAVVLTMIVFSAVDDPRACEDLGVLLSIAETGREAPNLNPSGCPRWEVQRYS